MSLLKKKEVQEKQSRKKRPEDQEYVIKKLTWQPVVRVLLWLVLIVACVSGIVHWLKPDETKQVKADLKSLEETTAQDLQRQSELYAYAEDFTWEYFTYGANGQEEQEGRLAQYCSDRVAQMTDLFDYGMTSNVRNVTAYRLQETLENHINVYVRALVTLDYRAKTEGEETEARSAWKTYTLCVPIQITQSGYVVEDVPLLVSDESYYDVRDAAEKGVALERIEDPKVLKEALANFFKALYTEKQSVIDYFLDPEADKTKFSTFAASSTLAMSAIQEVSAYRTKEGDALCLVTYLVKDTETGMTMLQKCNLLLDDTSAKDRIYIKDIDTKTINLKEE